MERGTGRNVVFVVLDTVRKDRLSPYGGDRSITPTLDSFAGEATVFEQAVAPAPWTLPVHASLFTGTYPHEHGASQATPYLDDATTLAESLSRAGYETACYSSNAWITPYTRLTDGFGDYDNFFEVLPGDFLSGPLARAWQTINDSDRLRSLADRIVAIGNVFHERLAGGAGADSKTPQVIDRTIEFIDGAEEPYFAFVNLMDAHLPYHPPDEYTEEIAPGVDSTAVCQNSKEYNSGARDIDEAEWADIKALYDAELRHVDAELSRLFAWLKENGEWEDSLVIVCADHGELHGEHDLYGHEFCIYDLLVNVPLLLKAPGLPQGRRDDQVELLDLYHTVLDFTGVEAGPAGEPLDPSRSMLDASYRDFEDGDLAFVEYERPVIELNQLEAKARRAGITLDRNSRFYSRMAAVRRTDAKYIRNERIEDEFYDLADDPEESLDRYGNGDPAQEQLAESLACFGSRGGDGARQSGSDDGLAGMGEQAQARLRELGYIE